MLGAFLNLDTKTTWVFPIFALQSGFKPHVSNFGFIWSFALLCSGYNKGLAEGVMGSCLAGVACSQDVRVCDCSIKI